MLSTVTFFEENKNHCVVALVSAFKLWVNIATAMMVYAPYDWTLLELNWQLVRTLIHRKYRCYSIHFKMFKF